MPDLQIPKQIYFSQKQPNTQNIEPELKHKFCVALMLDTDQKYMVVKKENGREKRLIEVVKKKKLVVVLLVNIFEEQWILWLFICIKLKS